MKRKSLMVISALLCAGGVLASCGTDPGTTQKEAIKYSVTFKIGDETFGTPVQVEENAKVTEPTNPETYEEDGVRYEFSHWELDEQEFDFETPITGDITLKAVFNEIDFYQVTFKNGDTVLKTEKVDDGEKATAPTEAPTKLADDWATYSFVGWAKDNAETDESKIFTAANLPLVDGDDQEWNAIFEKVLKTFTATVKFDYDGGAESVDVQYNYDNREAKLAEIQGKLPSETDLAAYVFEELPAELPAEDKEYKVKKVLKSFSTTFADATLPKELTFLNRSGETSTLSEGLFKINSLDNGYLRTTYKYNAFKLEFTLKTGTGRLAMILGEDAQNKGYSNAVSTAGGCVGLYFMNNFAAFLDNDIAHVGKDGTDSGTHKYTPTLDLAAAATKFTITYQSDALTVAINDVIAINKIKPTTKLNPGNIIFAKAGTATDFEFSSFSMEALEYVEPLPGKSFVADFSGSGVPAGLTFQNRNQESATVSGGVLTSLLNNSNLITTDSFSDFELKMTAKADTGRICVHFGNTIVQGYVAGNAQTKDGIVGIMYCCDNTDNPSQMRLYDAGKSISGNCYNTKVKEKAQQANLINDYVELTLKFCNGTVSGSVAGEELMTNIPVTEVSAGQIYISGGAPSTTIYISALSVTDLAA